MLKQTLQQKLQQKLSPQQIQLMKLLQLPTVELEMRIKEELEANPALDEGSNLSDDEWLEDYEDDRKQEEGDTREDFEITDYLDDETVPEYKTRISNSSADDEIREYPLKTGLTFHESLLQQLNLRVLGPHKLILGRQLIGMLDDNGFLRRELEDVVDDMAFTQNITATKEELEEILEIIQEFDPPGVGAHDLRESLLIQLKRRDRTHEVQNAISIIDKQFEAFTRKHYSKITRTLNITEDELRDAIEVILKLNPKPGSASADNARAVEQIIPDFILSTRDGQLDLQLNSRNMPELRINRRYSEMLETYSAQKEKPTRADKDAVMFVKQKLDAAKWFVDAIKQRHHTLESTMKAIIERQKEYFLTGDETKLKPMILKDIADVVDLDISTVSRVANSKYVQTPYGTFLLKSFFSESLVTDSGEEVSTREVKKILQDLIDAEDKKKPVTDEKLCLALKEKGYNIARRTVAKYREQLSIPVARLRREI